MAPFSAFLDFSSGSFIHPPIIEAVTLRIIFNALSVWTSLTSWSPEQLNLHLPNVSYIGTPFHPFYYSFSHAVPGAHEPLISSKMGPSLQCHMLFHQTYLLKKACSLISPWSRMRLPYSYRRKIYSSQFGF